jgi:hypothetical protein
MSVYHMHTTVPILNKLKRRLVHSQSERCGQRYVSSIYFPFLCDVALT